MKIMMLLKNKDNKWSQVQQQHMIKWYKFSEHDQMDNKSKDQ